MFRFLSPAPLLFSPCGISTLEPAPIRTFEDGGHIPAAIRCGIGLAAVVVL